MENPPRMEQESILKQSSHPQALIFMLAFRTAALVLYFLGSFFSSFILTFVVIILLLAFDFWTVKNVSGRLLVGLRWFIIFTRWNEIKEDGTNEWIFESRQNRAVNPTDSRVFWTALYSTTAIWSLFSILAVIRLQTGWFLVTVVAISMSMANLVGYTKCDKDAKTKTNLMGDQSFMSNMVSNAISSRLNSLI